jgi:hypothetical protein
LVGVAERVDRTAGLGVFAILLLSDQQLDAAIEYLQRHREEVERDYAQILRLSEERRQKYDKLYEACA